MINLKKLIVLHNMKFFELYLLVLVNKLKEKEVHIINVLYGITDNKYTSTLSN